jgi:hypothetical protein
MSIQSTTELTRKEAEERFIFHRLEIYKERLKKDVAFLSDRQIEDELESTFDNFMIKENL